MTVLLKTLAKMSPMIICATSSGAQSSNPPDPTNQAVQKFDHQDLAPTKIHTQDTENLIAMASRVSLLPRASEHRLLSGRYGESPIEFGWYHLLRLFLGPSQDLLKFWTQLRIFP